MALPHPDPHEWPPEPGATRLPAATVVFAAGAGSPEDERFADRQLDLRPGLLIVFGR